MYSSHYMYLGLVKFLHTLYFFIYDDDVFFSPYHTCCFFSLFIHMFLSLYNLFIFHT